MNVLAVNCGSSTLKFKLFDMADSGGSRSERRLARGLIERIGGVGSVTLVAEDRSEVRQALPVRDHAGAVQVMFDWLRGGSVDAVGHRVVHGGPSFTGPLLLEDSVISEIESLAELAPLHNLPALGAIRAVRTVLGPAVPMVATFDTAFFRDMPERASEYAIPRQLAKKHGIRRYGFHGLAHRYMAERYAELASRSLEQVRLVTLQLGNGCSATAIGGGRPVDTSMGFTPLEGLVMGTRSGDVDPSIVTHLARAEGIEPEEVVRWLNTKSGLLGVSGRSSDMRELLAAEAEGDQGAAVAVELFCYRVKKYVGAYFAALGSTDALVFGGGIGENAPAVRGRICAGMEWCGLRLDAGQNEATVASEGRISAEDSKVAVYVLPVDEELIIARDTARCLEGERRRLASNV